jgi:hypothetical protein
MPGFTLTNLLIMIFWETCGMLFDDYIRHWLGVSGTHSYPPLVFVLGVFTGFAVEAYFSKKRIRKQAFFSLMIVSFCAALLTVCLGRHWGGTIHVVDFACGFYVAIMSWESFFWFWLIFCPFPACRGGKCLGWRNYYRNSPSPQEKQEENTKQWIVYECGCGDKYSRRGKRFMELDSERNAHPYKRLVGFHKWADDTDPKG